jgi:hypothetical protein
MVGEFPAVTRRRPIASSVVTIVAHVRPMLSPPRQVADDVPTPAVA